ncbi:MAG TPA: hypothetical protein P5081_16685 [Phycisphaerae bacterium]|nr:hypothetical protein [Phycisphaerae bacterium]
MNALSRIFMTLITCLLTAAAPALAENAAAAPPMVRWGDAAAAAAIHDLNRGDLPIRGTVDGGVIEALHVRVTTDRGHTSSTSIPVRDGSFRCDYPADFAGAPALAPSVLFVDVSSISDFDASDDNAVRAEATRIVFDAKTRDFPDLPSAFTNDLLDDAGRRDQASAEFPVIRSLTNLYFHSRGARRAGVFRPGFDLARPADLRAFQDNVALCDFDYRDRDWSTPLNHRVRRTFWQAVWDHWFGAGNDHPLDGDPTNGAHDNYRPYTFTNDFADILITYLMRRDLSNALDDNLDTMCREGVENLLAMRHQGSSNFARRDALGREHTYTDGAFRYGMFEDGTFLVEGTGWFFNSHHTDYVAGGVFNGRAVWALGEALKRYPDGEFGGRIRGAIGGAVRFCLIDARASGYTKSTPKGRHYWRDCGESAYLLLGMLAACEVDPDLRIADGLTLRDATIETLDALVEQMQPHGQWSVYADHDSVILAALADGVRVLGDHPHASQWRSAAIKAGNGWLNARVDAKEYPAPLVHFAARVAPDRISFRWGGSAPGEGGRNHIFFYKTGHWIHALAKLHRMTGDPRYLERAERMVGYLCGDNPYRVRIFSELGGVYNWVDDTDGDGIEDALRFDMYPESTAFCQIGIMHLLDAKAPRERD